MKKKERLVIHNYAQSEIKEPSLLSEVNVSKIRCRLVLSRMPTWRWLTGEINRVLTPPPRRFMSFNGMTPTTSPGPLSLTSIS